MIKNIVAILQISAVCCFIVCFFLLGTSIDEIKKTVQYADFFSNQEDYKRLNVSFDDIDTLVTYGGEYATSDTNQLKGIRILLDDDWSKFVCYSKDEDGYDATVEKNITFPVWFCASSKTAFCSYSIKTEFMDYLHFLFSKNHYFQWWSYTFATFLISILLFITLGIISQSLNGEIMLIFYWLLAVILVPFSFVAVGNIFIIPFNSYNEKVLNYADYEPKKISIDSFDISANYSGSRSSSTFQGYYGNCYSHELSNITIQVSKNSIINANGYGGYVKKKMLVWYNPKTKNAFLANDIFPLKSYKDTLKSKFYSSRFCFYCLGLLITMLVIIYFHNKFKGKKLPSHKDNFGSYDDFV